MSKVSKCDFCGAIYDEQNPEVGIEACIHIYGDSTDTSEVYDACPQCTELIRTVINALKSGEDFTINIIPKEE